MRRKLLAVLILIAAVLSLLYVNKQSMERERVLSQATRDFSNACSLLGCYAADHSGSLPESWEQLEREGYIKVNLDSSVSLQLERNVFRSF